MSCCSPAAFRARISPGTAIPRIRDFLPDPSCFQDMDKGAKRLADAVQTGEIHRDFRRLRRRRCDQRGLAGAASAPPRRRADRLYPRPADGGLWPIGQSAGRAEGAWSERRRVRRLRGPGVRSARGSEGRRARRYCRRPPPVCQPASRRFRDDQSEPARRERGRGGARASRGGRDGLPPRRCAAARASRTRRLRGACRAEDPRPARPRRPRHSCRRGAAEEPQPRLRHAGSQGSWRRARTSA